MQCWPIIIISNCRFKIVKENHCPWVAYKSVWHCKSTIKVNGIYLLFIIWYRHNLSDLFSLRLWIYCQSNVKIFSAYFVFILFDNGRMTGPLTGYWFGSSKISMCLQCTSMVIIYKMLLVHSYIIFAILIFFLKSFTIKYKKCYFCVACKA